MRTAGMRFSGRASVVRGVVVNSGIFLSYPGQPERQQESQNNQRRQRAPIRERTTAYSKGRGEGL
jgi:hypothetical protein